jgi:hypothetical protein
MEVGRAAFGAAAIEFLGPLVGVALVRPEVQIDGQAPAAAGHSLG